MDSKNFASSSDAAGDSTSVDADIVVIGGGIAGLGVAVEALQRGYSVVLLERGAGLAQGTSANSLRIMHGGFRYLQSLAIGRVVTSMTAQAQLVRKHPELLTPLPCLMPLKRWGLRSYYPVLLAVGIFRIFAHGLKWPATEYRPMVLRGMTQLGALSPTRGKSAAAPVLQWWDWQLNSHVALAEKLEREILAAGGKIQTNSLVHEVVSFASLLAVKFVKASAANPQPADDGEAEGEGEIRARAVIDCRGSGVASSAVSSWAIAFNLLITQPVDDRYGITLAAGDRLLFAVPRRDEYGQTYGAIGTWYLPDAQPYADKPPVLSEDTIAAAIADVNRALPEAHLTREQVHGTEVGVLPCTSRPGVTPVTLLGPERIETHGRVIKVLSTKYTTFETQARWAVNAVDEALGR